MSLARLAGALRAGELSPREAVERYLRRIEAIDGELNAYITVRADEALAEADALERTHERGPLWGVPVALKDVIDVAGTPTTAASRILADYVPERDAHVVARLRRAGAIVLGKLNLHEFAYGALTTSPHFGPARNPWAPERICGGSSGGNGAAIAADLVAGSVGTDTAGSIRIPSCLLRRHGAPPLDRPRLQPGRRGGGAEFRRGRADRADGDGLRAPPRRDRRARSRRSHERRGPRCPVRGAPRRRTSGVFESAW